MRTRSAQRRGSTEPAPAGSGGAGIPRSPVRRGVREGGVAGTRSAAGEEGRARCPSADPPGGPHADAASLVPLLCRAPGSGGLFARRVPASRTRPGPPARCRRSGAAARARTGARSGAGPGGGARPADRHGAGHHVDVREPAAGVLGADVRLRRHAGVAGERTARVRPLRGDLLGLLRLPRRSGDDQPPLRARLHRSGLHRGAGLRGRRLLRPLARGGEALPRPLPGPARRDPGRDGPGERGGGGGSERRAGRRRPRPGAGDHRAGVRGGHGVRVPGGDALPRRAVQAVPLPPLLPGEAGLRARAAGGLLRRRPGQLHLPPLRAGRLLRPGVRAGRERAGADAEPLPLGPRRGAGRGAGLHHRQPGVHQPAGDGGGAPLRGAGQPPADRAVPGGAARGADGDRAAGSRGGAPGARPAVQRGELAEGVQRTARRAARHHALRAQDPQRAGVPAAGGRRSGAPRTVRRRVGPPRGAAGAQDRAAADPAAQQPELRLRSAARRGGAARPRARGGRTTPRGASGSSPSRRPTRS